MKKWLMMVPLLVLFGCSGADDGAELTKLETENALLAEENGVLEKQVGDLQEELDQLKNESKKKEEELNKKVKEIETELSDLYASTGAVNESEELGRGIPIPGNPDLPSPKPGTYVPTAEEKETMYYFDPSEERYAFAVTDGGVLHVRNQPSQNGDILTSLTDGYEMRTLAYSEDRMWFYIETTTYDGEPISGYVSVMYTE